MNLPWLRRWAPRVYSAEPPPTHLTIELSISSRSRLINIKTLIVYAYPPPTAGERPKDELLLLLAEALQDRLNLVDHLIPVAVVDIDCVNESRVRHPEVNDNAPGILPQIFRSNPLDLLTPVKIALLTSIRQILKPGHTLGCQNVVSDLHPFGAASPTAWDVVRTAQAHDQNGQAACSE